MTNDIITIQATAVRKAGLVDLSTAATSLAAAFHHDPVFGYCIPDPARRRVVLPAFFRLVAGLLSRHDEIHVDGEGVGAALWVPPGEVPVTEADAEAFQDELAEMLGEDAERTFEIVGLLDEHHPHDDHHYLWFLGVRPTRQGEGIGAALMAPVLAQADAGRVPAYLEATSPDNRRLYERHGFVTVDELSVPGSPSLWAMWREADPAA